MSLIYSSLYAVVHSVTDRTWAGCSVRQKSSRTPRFFFCFFLGKQVNFTGQNWCFSWAHSDMDELFVIAVSSTPVEMILCPGAECFSTETGGAARWMQHVNVSCKISESFFLLHIEVGVSDSGSAHNLPFGCRHIESFVKKFHKKWELNGFE